MTRDTARTSFTALSLVMAAVLVAGCSAPDDAAPSVMPDPGYTASYEEAPCPSPNFPGAPTHELGPEYSCGYLTVPETRTDPDGRSIRIAVATVAAVSATPAADPIVYLDGGPGNTGLFSAANAVDAGMNADRAVVFVDQRGTLHSEPHLSCPEQDAFYAEVLGLAYADPATGGRSDAATQACRDRLAGEGVALASYNTAENAADIADLRVAMGIDEWNLYGVSYGSTLALTVLRDYPAGIRSAVLDSVVPPDFNSVAEFWPAAAAAYDQMYAACSAQPECAAAYPDLQGVFTDTVTRLDTQPLRVSVPAPSGEPVEVIIDGYRLANSVGMMLAGGPAASAGAPGVIFAVAAGDGSLLASMLAQSVPPSDFIGMGLQWGVFCQESIPLTSPVEVLEFGKSALPQFPDTVLSMPPQVPRFFDDCAIWDVGVAGPLPDEPGVSDIPVLMMGGTFDAIASPSWHDAVTGLSASQTVHFPGLGHTVYLQSVCPALVMGEFLTAPDKAVDQACVGEMGPPVFTVAG